MGKGDTRRPENRDAFKAGFERTFGSKPSDKEMDDYEKRRRNAKEKAEIARRVELTELKEELDAAIGRRTIPHSGEDDDESFGSETDATGYADDERPVGGGAEGFDFDNSPTAY